MCSKSYGTWSVILFVSLSFHMPITMFSATVRHKAAKAIPMGSVLHWLDFKNGNLRTSTAFESYGMKTSKWANTLMSMAYLDQILLVLSMVEAVEVTRRPSIWSWFAKNTTYQRS